MKGLPTAAPSSPFKMIIIIANGIVYFLEVPNYIPATLNRDIVDELNRLNVIGIHSQHIAYTLRLLAEERSTSQAVSDRVDLVWTGPEITGSQSRDTGVVVRELFNTAKISVLISSFAIDKKQKARELFIPHSALQEVA